MAEHLLIPDTQIRPGVSLNHLNALGNYIVERQPDVIIQIGDFADMHSLSSYDLGKRSGEGARYEADIAASKRGMEVLMQPIKQYNIRQRSWHKPLYVPRKVITLGNHEQRIVRHTNAYPVLYGRLSYEDLGYQDFGWEVHDFLETVEIDGILYSHYFPRNAQGRVVQTHRGATNARLQVQREGQSCSSGHLQGLDFHVQQRRERRDYGIIAGSFYLHEEDYLSPQGTAYWRGVVYKHEVNDGNYDPMFISIQYLLDKWWDGNEYTA